MCKFWPTSRDIVSMTMWFAELLQRFSGLLLFFSLSWSCWNSCLTHYWCHLRGRSTFMGHSVYTDKELEMPGTQDREWFPWPVFQLPIPLKLFLQSLPILPGKGKAVWATFCFLGKDQEMPVLGCLLLVREGLGGDAEPWVTHCFRMEDWGDVAIMK